MNNNDAKVFGLFVVPENLGIEVNGEIAKNKILNFKFLFVL